MHDDANGVDVLVDRDEIASTTVGYVADLVLLVGEALEKVYFLESSTFFPMEGFDESFEEDADAIDDVMVDFDASLLVGFLDGILDDTEIVDGTEEMCDEDDFFLLTESFVTEEVRSIASDEGVL